MQMISFKQFLSEAADGSKPKYTALDVDTAIATLNKYAKNALWMLYENRPIYRGDDRIPEIEQHGFAVVDTTATKRKSQNTSNYYTVILDNHPDRQHFPKRGSSFIASNGYGTASDYAYDEPYILVPFDDAKIGVVNDYDMWSTQITLFGYEHDIEWFNKAFRNAGLKASIEDILNFDKKLKAGNKAAFTKFQDAFGSLIGDDEQEKRLSKQFIENVWAAYSPKGTKHTVTDTKGFRSVKKETEVWVGGKVIMIAKDMWKALRKAAK